MSELDVERRLYVLTELVRRAHDEMPERLNNTTRVNVNQAWAYADPNGGYSSGLTRELEAQFDALGGGRHGPPQRVRVEDISLGDEAPSITEAAKRLATEARRFLAFDEAGTPSTIASRTLLSDRIGAVEWALATSNEAVKR